MMLTQQKESAIRIVLDLTESDKISKSDALALILALVDDGEKKNIFYDTIEQKRNESN